MRFFLYDYDDMMDKVEKKHVFVGIAHITH
jgi:hypothetical protein